MTKEFAHLISIPHNVGEHGTSKENHVLSEWCGFDSHFELLKTSLIVLTNQYLATHHHAPNTRYSWNRTLNVRLHEEEKTYWKKKHLRPFNGWRLRGATHYSKTLTRGKIWSSDRKFLNSAWKRPVRKGSAGSNKRISENARRRGAVSLRTRGKRGKAGYYKK